MPNCPRRTTWRTGRCSNCETGSSLPLPVPAEIVALLTAEDGTEDAAQCLEDDDEDDECEEIVHSFDV